MTSMKSLVQTSLVPVVKRVTDTSDLDDDSDDKVIGIGDEVDLADLPGVEVRAQGDEVRAQGERGRQSFNHSIHSYLIMIDDGYWA